MATSMTGMTGLIKASLDGSEFPCGLCRGRGRRPLSKAQCPACGGRGLVSVAPPAMTCAYCNGRGEVPARSGISCTVCGGKGVVTVGHPIEVCPGCRGTGAAPNSKLPCLVCRGKGVVTTREDKGALAKVGAEDSGWVVARARGAMAREIKRVIDYAGRPEVERQAEPSPIFLQQVHLIGHGHKADEGMGAGYVAQPQRKKETRAVSAGVVSGLVRRLMATERARILRREGIDLGRYAMEKRTQRWRESKRPLK